ncbi:MAG: CvpA family protein [Bacteroidetes bacterium]|nr:CvpA family protein [Bacteroidota bacterium]
MNILDIILVIPMIWLAYRGFTKGLVIELTSLVALILGIWIALHFSYFASDFLTEHFEINQKYLHIVAFIITFIVIIILVYLVGKLVERLINLIALGFINKLAGAVFGVLKAALLLSVVILIINNFDKKESVITPKLREGSVLYKSISSIIPTIIPWLDLDELMNKEVPGTDIFRKA